MFNIDRISQFRGRFCKTDEMEKWYQNIGFPTASRTLGQFKVLNGLFSLKNFKTWKYSPRMNIVLELCLPDMKGNPRKYYYKNLSELDEALSIFDRVACDSLQKSLARIDLAKS